MEGQFTTAEVVNLLDCRVPRRKQPQFRLQNFLLRKEDWESNPAWSLHIGEQGELATLRSALGEKRLKILQDTRKKYEEKAWVRYSQTGNPQIFPTQRSYNEFVRDVEKRLGKTIVLLVE